MSYNQSAFTLGNANSPSGVQVAFIQNGASISQSVYLDAGQYNITFLAAQRAYYQVQWQQVAILVDGSPVSVITPMNFNIPATATVAAWVSPATAYNPYQSADFIVSGGMHTITFQGLAPSSADSTIFIDSVAVNNMNGINDGSFEQAVQAYGTYSFNPNATAINTNGMTPWQFSGPAGVATNASAFTIGNTAAPNGNQVAFIKGDGSMSQTVFLTTGLYSLSFEAVQRATSEDAYQELEVLIDGVPEGTVIPSNTTKAIGIPQWGLYQTNAFTVTTGLHTVTFVGLNPQGGDNTALVDEVSF